MTAPFITVPNWEKFQQYRDRSPDWIKLHMQLLDDLTYRKLPDAHKACLVAIWLLCARTNRVEKENRVPNDPDFLSAVTGCKFSDHILDNLNVHGFVQFCTETYESVHRREESRTEEKRVDAPAASKYSPEFEEFWKSYSGKFGPRGSKSQSFTEWRKCSPVQRKNLKRMVGAYMADRDEKKHALYAERFIKQYADNEPDDSGPARNQWNFR